MVVAVNIGCTLHVLVEDRAVEVRQVRVLGDPLVMDQNHIHLDCRDIHYLDHHNCSLAVVVDHTFEHEVAPFGQLMYQKLLLLLLSLVVELVEQLVSSFLLCQKVE